MARNRAILNTGRPLRNRDRIHDLPARLSRLRPFLAAAEGPTRPEMCGQFPLQRPARLRDQAAIDRLVRHAHRRVIRIFGHEPAGDLGGRPVGAKLGVRPRARVRVECPMPMRSCIPKNLATNRRRGSSQDARHRTHGVPGGEASGDRLLLAARQGTHRSMAVNDSPALKRAHNSAFLPADSPGVLSAPSQPLR